MSASDVERAGQPKKMIMQYNEIVPYESSFGARVHFTAGAHWQRFGLGSLVQFILYGLLARRRIVRDAPPHAQLLLCRPLWILLGL